MLNCREATRLADEALEHRLPLGSRIGLKLHLMMCRYCNRYNTQVRFIHEAMKRYAEKEIEEINGVRPPEAMRERWRRCLKERGAE
ncbi:MAG: zf-HC2 domain-containing protein [Deltaproteobacteria bacterium]|nr:zf-HC2 domain-containing protein [Deltaproteobacteria bacterium]